MCSIYGITGKTYTHRMGWQPVLQLIVLPVASLRPGQNESDERPAGTLGISTLRRKLANMGPLQVVLRNQLLQGVKWGQELWERGLRVSTEDNYFHLNSGVFCFLYLKNEGPIKSHFCIFFYMCRTKERKFCLIMPIQ